MSEHRHSFTLRLMAFVKDQPLRWIPATAFEQFGRQAWRTRLSEARRRFKKAGDGDIENRVRIVLTHEAGCPAFGRESVLSCLCDVSRCVRISEYRYVPQADPVVEAAHDLNQPTAGRLI